VCFIEACCWHAVYPRRTDEGTGCDVASLARVHASGGTGRWVVTVLQHSWRWLTFWHASEDLAGLLSLSVVL
jgi:hypothetical protein